MGANNIMDGTGDSIVIAGRKFSLAPPKARRGRRVIAAYGELIKAGSGDENAPETAIAQMEACDKIRAAFSDEFAEAEDWLLDNATDEELVVVAQKLVVAAVPKKANLEKTAQPGPPQNRAQRRKSQKK